MPKIAIVQQMTHSEPIWPESDKIPIRRQNRHYLAYGRVARIIAWCTASLVVLPFVLTILYSAVPPVSTLMLMHWLRGLPVERQWLELESISPQIIRAVISSEDSRFCTHHGVDWREMRLVLGADNGPFRGASTLTMQTAKNLFLWHDYPYLRKPLEIVLAHWLEIILPKRRIVEIYLNIAEWGSDGTFGIEAGAQKAFKRSASALNHRQAALMAVTLPNPHTRNPAQPKAFHKIIAKRLQQRMNVTNLSCIQSK